MITYLDPGQHFNIHNMKSFEICSILIHKVTVDRDREANVEGKIQDWRNILLHKEITSRP
jgi:hypothetical protein